MFFTFESARVNPLKLAHSMPAVLATEPAVMQNSPFLPPVVTETTTSTHCTYPLRDGRLSWLRGLDKYLDGKERCEES